MTSKNKPLKNKPLKNPHLVFPEFDDIKVSTKTFIAMTNLTLNLKKLFEFLPVTEFIVIPKKRGRKKKSDIVNPNTDIAPGSIITLKFEGQLRGVDLKKKKNQTKKKRDKWFRNSFTVVIIMKDKPVNFKICQNGMFQITGCKTDEHAENCVKYIWNYIKDTQNIYSFSRNTTLETLFVPAMRNIDFGLGFLIDREKLAHYMSVQTEFHSLLETSFGYTGVNIKIPITKSITTLKVKKLTYNSEQISEQDAKSDEQISEQDAKSDEQISEQDAQNWTEEIVSYNDYLALLSEKDRNKKLNKDRYNTFLVFHSGKVIFSSIEVDFARDTYYYFLNIIRTCYDQIEERLDISDTEAEEEKISEEEAFHRSHTCNTGCCILEGDSPEENERIDACTIGCCANPNKNFNRECTEENKQRLTSSSFSSNTSIQLTEDDE